MFIGEPMGDPHNRDRLEASRICDELAEVRVVRPRELILDEDDSSLCVSPADDIRLEDADQFLDGFDRQLQADRVSEQ